MKEIRQYLPLRGGNYEAMDKKKRLQSCWYFIGYQLPVINFLLHLYMTFKVSIEVNMNSLHIQQNVYKHNSELMTIEITAYNVSWQGHQSSKLKFTQNPLLTRLVFLRDYASFLWAFYLYCVPLVKCVRACARNQAPLLAAQRGLKCLFSWRVIHKYLKWNELCCVVGKI